jgi:hypothetical protein
MAGSTRSHGRINLASNNYDVAYARTRGYIYMQNYLTVTVSYLTVFLRASRSIAIAKCAWRT